MKRTAEQIVNIAWAWEEEHHKTDSTLHIAAQLVAARSLQRIASMTEQIRDLLESVGGDGIHKLIAEHARRARATAARRQRKERERKRKARTA